MTFAKWIALSFFFTSSLALGESQVEAYPQKSHDGDGYEVVMDGEVARKLFFLLEAPVREVETSDGRWQNKKADGILCGLNEGTGDYFCSLYVDRKGVAQ